MTEAKQPPELEDLMRPAAMGLASVAVLELAILGAPTPHIPSLIAFVVAIPLLALGHALAYLRKHEGDRNHEMEVKVTYAGLCTVVLAVNLLLWGIHWGLGIAGFALNAGVAAYFVQRRKILAERNFEERARRAEAWQRSRMNPPTPPDE